MVETVGLVMSAVVSSGSEHVTHDLLVPSVGVIVVVLLDARLGVRERAFTRGDCGEKYVPERGEKGTAIMSEGWERMFNRGQK